MKEESLKLLKKMLGEDAAFRPGQAEAIEAIVERKTKVLLVQRTGWGKSIVYFISTKMLRDRGIGPTLLISPLLSLMRNQIEMAEKAGVIRAARIDSSNTEVWEEVEHELEKDKVDILLISPERLANERFRTNVLPSIKGGIGLFVVDEAHCISDWGHDFRPDYRRITRILKELPPYIPILATTATANDRVVNDIKEQFGENLRIMRGGLARASLQLQNIILKDQAERLAWLLQTVPLIKGSGIIYCLTVADTRRVSEWLRKHGVDARPYWAGMDNKEKEQVETDLINNRVKAVVATVALGMGFDKPDLSFVIHYQRPGSVIAYYQQVGRAGRALKGAYGILLSGSEDDDIVNYFIDNAFPTVEYMEEIVRAIENSDKGLSIPGIQRGMNISWSRIEKALKLLEIQGIVTKINSKYTRTLTPWNPETERAEKVSRQRQFELKTMNEYINYRGCLMEFICRELDDPEAAKCGRCAGCAGEILPKEPDGDMVKQAITFLKRDCRIIEPRRKWPSGGVGSVKGNLSADALNNEGRVLCIYGDAGWGREVKDCKYRLRRYSDDLVGASAELIAKVWKPEPPPAWVTAIPSLRETEMVADFAKRLAERLTLEFRMIIEKVKDTEPQKTMQNSFQQCNNIIDAFEIRGECLPGPVLLVDDIADSRWTLTVAGKLLRENGSGVVWPFTLSVASNRGDV